MYTFRFVGAITLLIMLFCNIQNTYSQETIDSSWQHVRKNIVRYNISGGIIFGFDKNIILGYERIVKPNQSFSVNVGKVSFPKIISIITDSFELNKDVENKGFNVSFDYRFYLNKHNKFNAPQGVYVGPFYSYNQFERESLWNLLKMSNAQEITTTSKFEIHTIGFELGYQFLFWKRMALDLVMIGPGISSYRLNTKIVGNLNNEEREQLRDGLQQLLQQKFPGMNFIFADKEINSSGILNMWNIGFRYLVHIGYNF